MSYDPMPADPFLPEGVDGAAKAVSALYLALVANGFPESRAYDLVRDFFLAQAMRQEMG